MLNKALLGTPKEFKVTIGSQTHCTASTAKTAYMPGDLVTINISYNTGYHNATVATSTGTPVSKVNNNTYTFVMPSSDVTVTASASVLSFSIYVNKSGSGTVNVKSIADYGERVTVTLSPADGHSLQSISSSNVTLSGSGNTRTFVMPARNVTLTVAFQQDYHVVITVGHGTVDFRGIYSCGYTSKVGSIDRIPYWNSPGAYLISVFTEFTASNELMANHLYTTSGPGLQAIAVNGISLGVDRKNPDIFSNAKYPPIINSSLNGKKFRIKFDPPPTGYL